MSKTSVESLVRRARKTKHGFVDLKRAADQVAAGHARGDCTRIARRLFASEVHQARVLATFVFGSLAARSRRCLGFLRTCVSRDEDWRVQETLAKSFDRYCADTGYERALATIKEWLSDPNPNVRRAVTEGLRIWTARPYFREHPEVAVELLARHRDDASDYVRRSVGNALRDVSRKHRELVRAELATWDLTRQSVQQTHKLASRFLRQT